MPTAECRMLTTGYWLLLLSLHRLTIKRRAPHLVGRARVEGELDGVSVSEVLASRIAVAAADADRRPCDHRAQVRRLRPQRRDSEYLNVRRQVQTRRGVCPVGPR